jgi:calcium/proton exchanger cax
MTTLVVPAGAYTVTAGSKISYPEGLQTLSRGLSVILLILYAFSLFFQLQSHEDLFDVDEMNTELDFETMLSPMPAVNFFLSLVALVFCCNISLVALIQSNIASSASHLLALHCYPYQDSFPNPSHRLMLPSKG